MVVFNGGNLFRCESLTDLIRLIGLMYPVRVAQKELIPTLVFPQSASKIISLGQLILRRPLEKAVAIWAREERSMRYLQQVFPNITVYPSIDLAFFTGARSTKDCYTEERFFDQGCQGSRFSVRVAITIRAQRVGDLRHLGPIESGEIVDCMRQTIYDLLEADRDILLVVQARKDRDITNLVYKEFLGNDHVTLIEEYDPMALRDVYAQCDALIGMRLHSIILALSVGTPAVGYFKREWGLKNPGLMERFDLPYRFTGEGCTTLADEIESVLAQRTVCQKRVRDIIRSAKSEFLAQIATTVGL